MIAIYTDQYIGLPPITYFNLYFEEDNVQLLTLGGVPFDEGFTTQDMIDRATEIFEGNFSSELYQLTEIITG